MPKRALAGNWMPGMISVMLLKKMKKNIVVSSGRKPMPSGPMVCMMTWLRTNSTPDSAMFWMPRGTICFFDPPTMNNVNVAIVAKM